jgi:hypothetical protein
MNADALRDLGARLQSAGAAPIAREHVPPVDVAAGLERLRAVLAGGPESGDLTGDLTDAQLAAYAARYRHENAIRALGGGFSGWGADVGGKPQCSGCRAFIAHPTAQCEACGYLPGGGYVGAPAKTSHLERWR